MHTDADMDKADTGDLVASFISTLTVEWLQRAREACHVLGVIDARGIYKKHAHMQKVLVASAALSSAIDAFVEHVEEKEKAAVRA